MSEGRKLIGRVFGGRFKITDFLGEGGMGAIYQGISTDQPGGVAIKILSPSLATDPDFVRRFNREAKMAGSLRHRSTVRVLDHGIEEGTPYLVMELVKGADLAQILAHERRLPEARAIRIMAQVCSALAAAHDMGIVHRDLKPDNVMVLRDPADPTLERVKVLDFGIAKMMTPQECTVDALPVSSDSAPPSSFDGGDLTRMGTVLGTPDYMAPEQFLSEPVDARTDLYACGVLLHRILTGQIPLVDENPLRTSALRVAENGPRPSVLIPDLSPRLDELVACCLQREPSARPQSARKMQEQLLEMLPEVASSLLPLASGAAVVFGAGSVDASAATLPSLDTAVTTSMPKPVGDSGLPRLFTPVSHVSQVNLHDRDHLGLPEPPAPLDLPAVQVVRGRTKGRKREDGKARRGKRERAPVTGDDWLPRDPRLRIGLYLAVAALAVAALLVLVGRG